MISAFQAALSRRVAWIASARSGSAAVAQTLVGRVAVLGINLGCGILTARNLGAAGRGQQAAITMWPQFLVFLATVGIQTALLYEARKHPKDANSLVSTALVWSLLLSIIPTVVGILFVPHWLVKYDAGTIRFAQYLMLVAPAVMLGVTVSAICELNFDFSLSNVNRFLPPVLTLLTLVTVVLTHTLTPKTAALAYSMPSLLTVVMLMPRVWSMFVWTLSDFKRSSRRLFGYGIRIYGTHVLSTFGAQVDQVLVVGLLSPQNLGTYTVALSVSRVLNIVQTSMNVVLLPKVAGLSEERVVALVGSAARVSVVASSLGGLALCILMPLLLSHLFGHEFIAGVIVAQILVVESILAATTAILMQAFFATNRPGVTTVLQGVGLALAVPLMLVLIPRLGLVGAALALLGSTTLRLLFALVCFPVLLHRRMPSLILHKQDIEYFRSSITTRRPPAGSQP